MTKQSITIGINATCLTTRSSGATQRFRGLYNELFQRMSDVNFIVHQPKDCNFEEWFPESKNVTFIKTALTSEKRIARTFLGLHYWRSQIKEHNIKVFDPPFFPVLQSNGIRKLATIHDIRNIQLNSNYILKMLMRFLTSLSIHNCYKMITRDIREVPCPKAAARRVGK